jgi:hypothetical protein
LGVDDGLGLPNTNLSLSWIKVEHSAAWCGAKGLWLVARGFGREWTLDDVKVHCDPTGRSSGYLSLSSLVNAARSLGMAALPVRCELDWIKRVGPPVLTMHRFPKAGVEELGEISHVLVVLAFRDGRIFLIDPFEPSKLISVSEERFADSWTGLALVVARTEAELPRAGIWATAAGWILVVESLLLAALCGWRRLRGPASATSTLVLITTIAGCGQSDPLSATPGPLAFTRPADAIYTRSDLKRSGSTVLRTIEFVNRSRDAVRIIDVATGCTCQLLSYTRGTVRPNMRGSVSLACDLAGRTGLVRSLVLITTQSSSEGAETVCQRVVSDVFLQGDAHAVPSHLRFSGPGGAAERQTFQIRVPLAPRANAPEAHVERAPDSFEYELGRPVISERHGLRVASIPVAVTLRPCATGVPEDGVVTVQLSGSYNPVLVRLFAGQRMPH